MISYQYKFTNKTGEFITFNDHTTDPNKIYALQNYPSISKAVKNNEVDRNGQNNFWDFFSYYGKLTFNFTGIMVSNNVASLEEMKEKMLRVFSLPLQPTTLNDGYVKMEWTDSAGRNKTVDVKLVNDVQFDRQLRVKHKMSFIIQLKARTNYIYDSSSPTVANGVRSYYSMGGVFFPFVLPMVWGSGWTNVLTVNISGAGSFPIIRLYGETQQVINNPKITNDTTGEVFKINTVLYADSWVEINTETGTVVNNLGADITSLVDPNSAYINLVTGNNKLRYTSDEDPFVSGLTPTAAFSVTYKNYYAI